MLRKVLASIKENSAFSGLYYEGMSMLNRSGILEFLKERSRITIQGAEGDVQKMASLAAWSAGYSDAVTDLLNFREMYLDPQDFKPAVMDFGALDSALENGDLLEEEVNAIRNNQSS